MENPPATEIIKSSHEPLLIFGQGPVIDSKTRQIVQATNTPQGQEGINFWSKNLAAAARVLYERKVADNFIVMGGKTGGQEHASESGLIGREMKVLGIPANNIKLEEKSHDTLTNLVNFLNLYTNQDAPVDELTISILATSYHIPRLRVLMQLFAIPVKDGFVADEVLRYAARAGDVPDYEAVRGIEERLDMNYPQYFYSRQQGTEQRDIVDRSIKDDLWTRELLEYPAKWLPVVAEIKNDKRLRAIIEKVYTIYPKEELDRFGLNPADPSELLRSRLRQITYGGLESVGVNVDQWVQENKTQGWPPAIMQRLRSLLSI